MKPRLYFEVKVNSMILKKKKINICILKMELKQHSFVWSHSMRSNLSAKNKPGLINRTMKTSSEANPRLPLWQVAMIVQQERQMEIVIHKKILSLSHAMQIARTPALKTEIPFSNRRDLQCTHCEQGEHSVN